MGDHLGIQGLGFSLNPETQLESDWDHPAPLCALILGLWTWNVEILPAFSNWEADLRGTWSHASLGWDGSAPGPSRTTPDL